MHKYGEHVYSQNATWKMNASSPRQSFTLLASKNVRPSDEPFRSRRTNEMQSKISPPKWKPKLVGTHTQTEQTQTPPYIFSKRSNFLENMLRDVTQQNLNLNHRVVTRGNCVASVHPPVLSRAACTQTGGSVRFRGMWRHATRINSQYQIKNIIFFKLKKITTIKILRMTKISSVISK